MSIISDKTVEALLKYIGLDLEVQEEGNNELTQELRHILDKKLNDRKLTVRGAKPNKVKKSLVPEKAELLSNFEDIVSEGDESGYQDSGEEGDNKDKKEEKNKDDEESEDERKKGKEAKK